ncbi:MAG: hypothetical protein ACSLFB_08910 [Acidimicrobiales bacterium]
MSLGAILAHGVGGRTDLPLPIWLFAYGAGSALVISFVTLHILWRKPRLDSDALGSPGPSFLERASKPAAFITRLFGLVMFGVVIGAAWFGDQSAAANISPIVVYVLFWVGLQIASLVFGNLWSLLSPWNTLALGIEHFRGSADTRAADKPATHWPATIGIAGFVWLELCYHDPSSPRVLALAISLYAIAMAFVVIRFGRERLNTADAFAAWFEFLATMAPVFRSENGELRLRWPFAGLAAMKTRPGSVALVMVVLGSTAFDGLSRSTWWRNTTVKYLGWEATVVATIGLFWTIVIMYAIYVGAMKTAEQISKTERRDLVTAFLSSLVPIALAYAVGHYFSLFIFEGQQALALASDPFGRGWNLFGTIDWSVNYRMISTDMIAWVQMIAIVTGHVVGVVVAHDRAVSIFKIKVATKSQIPLLVVMVSYTVGGLTLLLGA